MSELCVENTSYNPDKSYGCSDRKLWNAVLEQYIEDVKRSFEQRKYMASRGVTKKTMPVQLNLFEIENYHEADVVEYDIETLRRYLWSESFEEVVDLAGHNLDYLRKGIIKLFKMNEQ